MKERYQNLITSMFGVVIFIIDIIAIVKAVVIKGEFTGSHVAVWAMLAGFGYIFLCSKDSLIEGLTQGLIKMKGKDD